MKTDTPSRTSEAGLAMITAVLVLGFLTIIGAALLRSTSVDVTISDNYRTDAQLQFIAEAGLEAAREALRTQVEARITADAGDAIETLSDGITAVLQDYDGADALLASSVDSAVLLDTGATDDVRYLDTIPVNAGGAVIGTYTVFLRNDAVDGVTSTADTNETLTILSIAQVGEYREVVELDVKKGRFPDIPSAVTLNGEVPENGYQTPTSNNFHINGEDESGVEASVNAVGVVDNVTSEPSVLNAIEAGADYSEQYCGEDAPPDGFGECASPPAPDIEDVSGEMGSEFTSPDLLLALVDGIAASATHTTCPDSTPWGSAAAPRVTVVNGDCSVPNNVDGWGMLVVKGQFTMGGNGEWNGLLIVVDDEPCNPNGAGGTPHYAANISGTSVISGGVFVASIVGGVLGQACLEFNGGGSANGGVAFNSENIRNAAAALPFAPIAFRQY